MDTVDTELGTPCISWGFFSDGNAGDKGCGGKLLDICRPWLQPHGWSHARGTSKPRPSGVIICL
jgi:hypothetical protein